MMRLPSFLGGLQLLLRNLDLALCRFDLVVRTPDALVGGPNQDDGREGLDDGRLVAPLAGAERQKEQERRTGVEQQPTLKRAPRLERDGQHGQAPQTFGQSGHAPS